MHVLDKRQGKAQCADWPCVCPKLGIAVSTALQRVEPPNKTSVPWLACLPRPPPSPNPGGPRPLPPRPPAKPTPAQQQRLQDRDVNEATVTRRHFVCRLPSQVLF